ncbi:MAG: hypothetical protein ABL857_05645 [Rickettsiales bacterium]
MQQAFDDYLHARKSLKQTIIDDYKRVLKQVMPDWLNKPIANINRNMVAKRHAKFGDSNSKAEQLDSPFVFPGDGKTGYNVEPRKVMKKIIDQSGVTFTLHDFAPNIYYYC